MSKDDQLCSFLYTVYRDALKLFQINLMIILRSDQSGIIHSFIHSSLKLNRLSHGFESHFSDLPFTPRRFSDLYLRDFDRWIVEF